MFPIELIFFNSAAVSLIHFVRLLVKGIMFRCIWIIGIEDKKQASLQKKIVEFWDLIEKRPIDKET